MAVNESVNCVAPRDTKENPELYANNAQKELVNTINNIGSLFDLSKTADRIKSSINPHFAKADKDQSLDADNTACPGQ